MRQSRKAGLLFSLGVFLGLVRETSRQSIELYSLGNFYVEIFYDKGTGDPLFLQAFRNMNGLDPYLNMIDIGDAVGIQNDGKEQPKK